MFKIFFTSMFLFALVSCSEQHADVPWHISRKSEPDSDIKVPQELWKIISGEQTEATVAADAVDMYNLVSVHVMLSEKSPGVLKHPYIKIEYVNGGGVLDLSEYLTGVDGSFYIQIQFNPLVASDSSQVYFVSKAQKRRIEGELWGSGCSQFLQLDRFYKKTLSHKGLLVNTTRNRHLSLLGGHFIYVDKDSKQVRLSQLTVTDSKNARLFCGGEAPGLGLQHD